MTESCFLEGKHQGTCGEYRGHFALNQLFACKDDIKNHLVRCHLGSEQLQEYELILARAGFYTVSENQVEKMWICPRHRYNTLGKFWVPSKLSCQYPAHVGKAKQVKDRGTIGIKMAKTVMQLYRTHIAVGSRICSTCRKKHKQVVSQEKWLHPVEEQVPEAEQNEVIAIDSKFQSRAAKVRAESVIHESLQSPSPARTRRARHSTVAEWVEEEFTVSDDETALPSNDKEVLDIFNDCFSKLSGLTSTAEFSPINSRLCTPLSETAKSTREKCIAAANGACRTVCEVIAPNDCETLLGEVRNGQRPFVSSELVALMTAHREAPTRKIKTQILSLYCYKFSSKKLIEIHEPYERITAWQVKKARAHCKQFGAGMPLEKEVHHRVRINTSKVDHFIEFTNRPYFYQDVSFGTRKLKLDSGECISMPNVVRTVTRSTMITQYMHHCKNENFEPLSRATLYRILEVREASQRKSLQGLDNTASDGAAAFDAIEGIVQELEKSGVNKDWAENCKKQLRKSKCYLKTEYIVHCGEATSQCGDHCRKFSLSDADNPEFQDKCDHKHDVTCEDCEALKTALSSIENVVQTHSSLLYNEEQKLDLLYDFSQARDSIFKWKSHILRSVHQNMAKQTLLQSLDDTSALIIVDWAMKFLQRKYREKQADWFAKRGLSWHISSVITKNESASLEVTSYAHIFDSCTQDWFAVSSILENLFHNIKKSNPKIKNVYLRSDEAGCYHNNNLIASVRDIGERTGLTVRAYDFSEPQHGKDMCDRILCPMKNSLKTYCNEGHDIVCAAHMREALKERPVRGSTAAVCQIDINKKTLKIKNIDNFSAFHNFRFEVNGVRIWKAFTVGTGKLIPYDKLYTTHQKSCGLMVSVEEEFFTPGQPRTLKPGKKHSENQNGCEEDGSFVCQEQNCFQSFDSLDDLEIHISLDQHSQRNTDNESFFDGLRREWANKFSTISCETLSKTDSTQKKASGGAKMSMGWALQPERDAPKKFPDVTRRYLTAKFDLGEVTGNKADPQEVSLDMRRAKDVNGTRIFQREQWLSKSQIKGFFSRLVAARRKQQMLQQSKDTDIESENIDCWIEEVTAAEEETKRNDLVSEVALKIGLKHPIIFDSFNLCDYFREEKLHLFKVPMLKSMCEYFEINFKSRDNKTTLINKLTEMVRACNCTD